jgi:hypothetical protein
MPQKTGSTMREQAGEICKRDDATIETELEKRLICFDRLLRIQLKMCHTVVGFGTLSQFFTLSVKWGSQHSPENHMRC